MAKQVKRTPQPFGEAYTGCLTVSVHRNEITGQRGKHRGWRTTAFTVNITHRKNDDFDLLGGFYNEDANIRDGDPLAEIDQSHPRDLLTYHITDMVSKYNDVFVNFPCEASIRHATRLAFRSMREIESPQHVKFGSKEQHDIYVANTQATPATNEAQ